MNFSKENTQLKRVAIESENRRASRPIADYGRWVVSDVGTSGATAAVGTGVAGGDFTEGRPSNLWATTTITAAIIRANINVRLDCTFLLVI